MIFQKGLYVWNPLVYIWKSFLLVFLNLLICFACFYRIHSIAHKKKKKNLNNSKLSSDHFMDVFTSVILLCSNQMVVYSVIVIHILPLSSAIILDFLAVNSVLCKNVLTFWILLNIKMDLLVHSILWKNKNSMITATKMQQTQTVTFSKAECP